MEKTKRLSKSSIAVIVLSILLVLSMVMGLTGAWFTDRDGTEDARLIHFGKVDISVSALADSTGTGVESGWSNLGTGNLVVPGSSYEGTITLSNEGDQDIYYGVISVSALLYAAEDMEETSQGADDWHPAANAEAIENQYVTVKMYVGSSSDEVTALEEDSSSALTMAAGSNNTPTTTTFRVEVVIDTDLPNAYEGHTYAGEQYYAYVTIVIGAIQSANIEADSAHNLTAAQVAANLILSQACVEYVAPVQP